LNRDAIDFLHRQMTRAAAKPIRKKLPQSGSLSALPPARKSPPHVTNATATAAVKREDRT